MAGLRIEGGSSTTGSPNVSTTYELEVRTPQTEANAGFVQLSSEVDPGLVTGTRTVRAAEISKDYRIRIGMDTPMFSLNFEGTSIATALINQTLSTMTTSQSGGFLSLNAGGSVATSVYAIVRTYRTFPLWLSTPVYAEMIVRLANDSATNSVSEWGFGYAATNATPSDGAFFRLQSGGSLVCVTNYATAENISSAITLTSIPNRNGTAGPLDLTLSQHYVVSVHADVAEFWINDVLVASLKTIGSQALPVSAAAQPLLFRTYSTASIPSAARRLDIGSVAVFGGDSHTSKPWPHIMVGAGGGAYQVQPGSAAAQTATYATGAAPAAGTWTTYTSPATATLGGLWLSPASLPAGGESDYPLFAYLNIAGTSAIPGKTLYITDIRIGETWVVGGLGATISILQWAIGVGSTASSLATTDAATSVAARKMPLGAQTLAASAAAGAMAAGFAVTLSTPLAVPAGTYCHIILRCVTGAASGQLRGSVFLGGYFE